MRMERTKADFLANGKQKYVFFLTISLDYFDNIWYSIMYEKILKGGYKHDLQ
jgi:hypothetical protein